VAIGLQSTSNNENSIGGLMKVGDLVLGSFRTKRIGVVCDKGLWVGWYVIYWFHNHEKIQHHEHNLEIL